MPGFRTVVEITFPVPSLTVTRHRMVAPLVVVAAVIFTAAGEAGVLL